MSGSINNHIVNAFYVEAPLQTMHSLLEIGAPDFHFKRKKLFQFPQRPNARGRKGLGQGPEELEAEALPSWRTRLESALPTPSVYVHVIPFQRF